MMFEEAANTLHDALNPIRYDPKNRFTVGIAETIGTIHVMCRWRKDVATVPKEWEGYPVEATYMGPIAPLGPT